jgi:hypothetical protein
VLAFNAWHNLVHLVTGLLLGLACARSAARPYALALGLAYVMIRSGAFWRPTTGPGRSST